MVTYPDPGLHDFGPDSSGQFSDDALDINLTQIYGNIGFSFNFTNHTGVKVISQGLRHVDSSFQIFITLFYGFGILGNICALVILARYEKNRNKKQTFLLKCLCWNDLIALTGSFVQMYMQLYMPRHLSVSRWFCVLRVLWRTFGLGSGSVAVVMAVERWMALTRPFTYQTHITYKCIQRSIISLWGFLFILDCLPFMGLGLYYDESQHESHRCSRYRFATELKDIIYACLILAVGLLMCICIVVCNLAVIQVLWSMGRRSAATFMRTPGGRGSKSNKDPCANSISLDELSFARMMAVLCIFFVLCWLPQMVSVARALIDPVKKSLDVDRIADICIALNFVFDPYVYVLLCRQHRNTLRKVLKTLCLSCCHTFSETTSNSGTQGKSSHDEGRLSDNGEIQLKLLNKPYTDNRPHSV